MVQTATPRFIFPTAPGHVYTGDPYNQFENLVLPFTLSVFTITLGAGPSTAGDYVFNVPLLSGGTFTLTVTTPGQAVALDGPLVEAAWNAEPALSNLYTAVAVGAVITLTAKTSGIDLLVSSIVATAAPAATVAIAVVSSPGIQELAFGRLYRISTAALPYGPAITGTERDARIAAPLATGVTLGLIRGGVVRQVNSTTLESDFIDDQPDRYRSGLVFPGLVNGGMALEVDPASADITPATTTVYAVLAAGVNSLVGSLTTAVDGGNTVQVNTSGFLRVTGYTTQPSFGSRRPKMVNCVIARGIV